MKRKEAQPLETESMTVANRPAASKVRLRNEESVVQVYVLANGTALQLMPGQLSAPIERAALGPVLERAIRARRVSVFPVKD